jgi:hypothetical protein
VEMVYPPRSEAEAKWAHRWPLPIGEQSMAAFAAEIGVPAWALPHPVDQDDPTALLGLWVRRRASRGTVTLFAHWEQDADGESSRLTMPYTVTRLAGRMPATWDSEREAWAPESIKPELTAIQQVEHRLLRWYHEIAHQLRWNRGGRPRRTVDPDLKERYNHALTKLRRDHRRVSIKALAVELELPPSTLSDYIRSGDLPDPKTG